MLKLLFLVGTLALAACGGGGGGAAPATADTTTATTTAAAPSANGFWGGKFNSGEPLNIAIFEGGDTMAFSANLAGTQLQFFTGQARLSGAVVTMSGSFFETGQKKAIITTEFSGTVINKVSIITTPATASNAFSTTASVNTVYDSAPPSVATLAGSYTGIGGTINNPATAATFSIGATGGLIAAFGTCRMTGTLTPHSSGKNYYSLPLSVSGCNIGATVTASANAIFNPVTKTLVIGARTPSLDDGIILSGTKP